MVDKQRAQVQALIFTPSYALGMLCDFKHRLYLSCPPFPILLWFSMSPRQTNQQVSIHLTWPSFSWVYFRGKIHIWVQFSLDLGKRPSNYSFSWCLLSTYCVAGPPILGSRSSHSWGVVDKQTGMRVENYNAVQPAMEGALRMSAPTMPRDFRKWAAVCTSNYNKTHVY